MSCGLKSLFQGEPTWGNMVQNMTSFDKTEALQKNLISFSGLASCSFLLFWKLCLIIKLGWGHIRIQAFSDVSVCKMDVLMYPVPASGRTYLEKQHLIWHEFRDWDSIAALLLCFISLLDTFFKFHGSKVILCFDILWSLLCNLNIEAEIQFSVASEYCRLVSTERSHQAHWTFIHIFPLPGR